MPSGSKVEAARLVLQNGVILDWKVMRSKRQRLRKMWLWLLWFQTEYPCMSVWVLQTVGEMPCIYVCMCLVLLFVFTFLASLFVWVGLARAQLF